MNKVAIVEVKVVLPANFKPHTLTYHAFSQMEKDSEKAMSSNAQKNCLLNMYSKKERSGIWKRVY